MSQPDYNALLAQIWGSSDDLSGLFPWLAIASNVIIGTNPAYSVTQFFEQMPSFAGVPTVVQGTVTTDSAIVSALTSPAGAMIAAGQYATGYGLQDGTTVTSFGGSQDGTGTMGLSQPAVLGATPVNVSVYTKPLVPNVVLNAYIALAQGSIFQARWGETWELAMANYIAHYCTLWAATQGNPATTAGQLAARGMALGIQTSQSADGLSEGKQALADLEGWGTYQLTLFGQIFATWAKAIGSVPMLMW
jgi:hypothetical protein